MSEEQKGRNLIKRLYKSGGLSKRDAQAILNITSKITEQQTGRSFEIIDHIPILRFGPQPVFVQNGEIKYKLYNIDQSKPFWAIAYNADLSKKNKSTVYAVANGCM